MINLLKYDGNDDICPICHEDFEENNEIKSTCLNRHKFHTECINSWINTDNFECPICRGLLYSEGVLWENYEISDTGLAFFRYKNKDNIYVRRYISPSSMVIRDTFDDFATVFSLPDYYGPGGEEVLLSEDDIQGNNLNEKCRTLTNINNSDYDIHTVNNVYIIRSIWDRIGNLNKKRFLSNFKRIFIFEIRELKTIENDDGEYNFVFPKGDQTQEIDIQYDSDSNIINRSDFDFEEEDEAGESAEETDEETNEETGEESDGIMVRKLSTKRKSVKRKSIKRTKSKSKPNIRRKSIKRKKSNIRKKSKSIRRRKSVRRKKSKSKSKIRRK